MSDEINIIVEEEACALFRQTTLSYSELARELRIETSEVFEFLAYPTESCALWRMKMAMVLRTHANQTNNPAWTNLIADTLYSSAVMFYVKRVRELAAQAELSPEETQRQLVEFMVREFGPELIEYWPRTLGSGDAQS